MSVPTPADQLRFLSNLQRLLAEGQFVATYKYALLLALADIAIEQGDDSGKPLTVTTSQIAEKFIEFYWRQCVPYMPRVPTAGNGQVLRQNTGRQAAIIRQISAARVRCGDSLATAKRNAREWKGLVSKVAAVVQTMPLWKLQTVGDGTLDFLYANKQKGSVIELRPGIAYCLRHFYGLFGDLVRGAWVRYVRRNNHDVLGTTADLTEFLFGSERADLSTIQAVLCEVEGSKCFYCERPLRGGACHVDHFIPWSRYPVDLGHNFVLAHDTCNSAKADHLAAGEYLAKWAERNRSCASALSDGFARRQVLHDLPTSVRVARWAYGQASAVGGLTWLRGGDLIPLGAGWELPLMDMVAVV